MNPMTAGLPDVKTNSLLTPRETTFQDFKSFLNLQQLIVLLITIFILSGCGGGGSGGSSDNPGNQSQPGETVINGKA